jgi:hypothetical protein
LAAITKIRADCVFGEQYRETRILIDQPGERDFIA